MKNIYSTSENTGVKCPKELSVVSEIPISLVKKYCLLITTALRTENAIDDCNFLDFNFSNWNFPDLVVAKMLSHILQNAIIEKGERYHFISCVIYLFRGQ